MKISYKLTLSYLLVASVASVTIFFTLKSYREINKTFASLMDDSTKTIEILNGLKQSAGRIISSTNEIGIIHVETNGQAVEEIAEEEIQLNESGYQDYETNLKRYEVMVQTLHPESANTFEIIRASGHNLIETSHELVELRKRNITGTQPALKRLEFESDESVFLTFIDKALEKESVEQIEAQASVNDSITFATRESLTVTVLTFILALFSGLYISFLISRRVIKLQTAIQRVGTGELETQIETASKDEIGDLSRSFNRMVGDLKGASETLRESEERHRKLFESNPFPMWVYDRETFGFLAVNDAAIMHYGYSRNEFLAMTLKDIRPADDLPILLAHIASANSSENPTSIWRHQKKDGTIFDVEITGYELDFGGRPAELVLANDITEKRRLEAESRTISQIIHGVTITHNLEDLLALVHQSIGQMLYAENFYVALYDPKTQLLNVPFCVDKYDEVAPPAKLGRGLTSYVFRTSKPILMTPDVIARLVDEGEIEVVGTLPAVWLGVPLRTADGTTGVLVVQHYEDPKAYGPQDIRFMSAVGGQIAMAIERQRSNDALTDSEERYRELIENAHDIIYTHDFDGKYTSINGAAENITGYTRDESLALSLEQIVAPDYIEKAREMITRKVAGETTTAYELEVIAKNGDRVTLEVNSRIEYENGIPVAVQGIARDITERKRAQKELERQKNELRVLFDLMPAKIWFKDTKNEIVRVNKHVADSIGMTVDEIEGKPAREIYPSTSEKFYRDDLEVIQSGRAKLGTVEIVSDENGNERWSEIDKVPYHDDRGEVLGIVVVEKDITEGKLLELDLRHKETLIRIAGRVTRTGGWTIDLPGNKVSWSDEVFDILEYARGDAPPLADALALYPEEWRDIVASAIGECSRNGAPFDLECEVLTGKAERIWVRICGEAEHNIDGTVTRLQGAFQDITLRKRADETLRLNEAKFRDLFDNAPVAYHELDTEGRFIRINRTEELLLGYTSDELKGRYPWEIIVEKISRDATKAKLKGKEQLKAVERTFIRKDGTHVSVLNEDRMILDSDGNILGIRSTLQDITDRKRLEEQLTHQALHDPLTKLANRVLFRDRVEHAINRAARKQTPLAVMFLDLDNFKTVNDSLGHAAGDELLVSVTERLNACLRSSDTPARLGGDEFAILIEDMVQADEAVFIAERIRAVLQAPFIINGAEVFVGVSIGIATAGEDRQTPEELLRNADVAMYMSKSNGKDRYTVFEDKMHDLLIKRIRLETDMRSAIDKRQFEVYYQPIIDLQSEGIMGMEALVRWNHPEDGLIPPLDFIPLAEETGLIVRLGEWILNEACSQASSWQVEHDLGDRLSITVNIGGRQFQETGLVEAVAKALSKSKLPPRSLILEITENTMLANTTATIETLTELKALGVGLAIDDFGTGYSSLSYLQKFPVDILKIDKSFVDRIAADKEGAAVAKAIITMGETLHLKTIAEGIESVGQQVALQDLGCELGQGFHFAKPLRATDMNEFLRASFVTQLNRQAKPVWTAGKVNTRQPVPAG